MGQQRRSVAALSLWRREEEGWERGELGIRCWVRARVLTGEGEVYVEGRWALDVDGPACWWPSLSPSIISPALYKRKPR